MNLRSEMPGLRLSAAVLSGVGLQHWPRLAGRLYDVAVPRGVVANKTPSPMGSANINIILKLLRDTLGVAGDVVECGVYRGRTLVSTGLFLKQQKSDKKVFGFDSFAGFDKSVEVDIGLGGEGDPHKLVGGFSSTSERYVRNKASMFDLRNLHIFAGYFQDTLPLICENEFSFVHLDCDLYESYRYCLEFFYKRLTKRGIILLDEYNDPPWPGCNRAVDEFLSDKKETLRYICMDNVEKFYITKE